VPPDLPAPLHLNAVEIALGLWQLAVGAGYLRRARHAEAPAPATDLLFASAWVLGALALLQPPLFRPVAAALLDASGLPAFLREADARIEVVERIPVTVWELLRGPLGWALEEEPPVPPLPLRGGVALEPRVASAVEALLVLWTRVACFGAAASAMIASFLLRRTLSNRSRLRRLEDRVADLEEALARAQVEQLREEPPGAP